LIIRKTKGIAAPPDRLLNNVAVIRDKRFQPPSVTTKPTGEGTELGLSFS
jgi:hypothetical protein